MTEKPAPAPPRCARKFIGTPCQLSEGHAGMHQARSYMANGSGTLTEWDHSACAPVATPPPTAAMGAEEFERLNSANEATVFPDRTIRKLIAEARRAREAEAAWKSAAQRVGEDLSTDGPGNYYDLPPQKWLNYALAAISMMDEACREEERQKDKAREAEAALREENERLRELLHVCNEVCICGCPPSEHESCGEEGEACAKDEHECLRTCPAILSMYSDVQDQVETLREENVTVRATRDAYRIDAERYGDAWEEAKARVAALTKALEEAEHGPACAEAYGHEEGQPCNCWKAAIAAKEAK